MKLSRIAANLVIGLALAGIVVPLVLQLPISLHGEWMAAVAIVICVAFVFCLRRPKPTS